MKSECPLYIFNRIQSDSQVYKYMEKNSLGLQYLTKNLTYVQQRLHNTRQKT